MQSLCTYFNVADASQLQWVHGVNSRSVLDKTVADAAIHVAEGDVHYAAEDALPVMAYEWQDIVDIDVATWLSALNAANKAVKLDFATPTAVEPTLQIIQRLKLVVPVILHANVFNLLSDEADEKPMEPEHFIHLAQQYCPQAVLSLGWSLKRENDTDGRVEESLIYQMSEMALKRLGSATSNIDYAIEIRAGYTSGWERGAALIFDPLPTAPKPATTFGENVVNAADRFRRAA